MKLPRLRIKNENKLHTHLKWTKCLKYCYSYCNQTKNLNNESLLPIQASSFKQQMLLPSIIIQLSYAPSEYYHSIIKCSFQVSSFNYQMLLPSIIIQLSYAPSKHHHSIIKCSFQVSSFNHQMLLPSIIIQASKLLPSIIIQASKLLLSITIQASKTPSKHHHSSVKASF